MPTRYMYARARELSRKQERGVTRPGSGGPTFRNIGGTVSSPYSDVVASTSGHEDSLEEAGALSKTMDPARWRARAGRRSLQNYAVRSAIRRRVTTLCGAKTIKSNKKPETVKK